MSFELYSTYDVTPYVPEILGPQLLAIKVVGMLTYEQAKLLSTTNLYDLHNSLIGKIDLLPTNVNELTYIMFKDSDDRDIILAKEYIDLYTLSETELTDLLIRIKNTSSSMKQVVSLRLLELGFKDFTITTAYSS